MTTHFLEIFQHHLVPPVVATELAFRMDIHVPEEDNAVPGVSPGQDRCMPDVLQAVAATEV